jgi:hypothetical protein
MKIFSDKSIIEQNQCTISDGKKKTEGVSITVMTDQGIDAVEVLLSREELKKAMLECDDQDGKERLWGWFELSYASFLTIPRVLMHSMPDDWQNQMASLLEEYQDTFTNQPDIGTRVQATKNGKLAKMPEFLKNYRHPDYKAIENMKQYSSK